MNAECPKYNVSDLQPAFWPLGHNHNLENAILVTVPVPPESEIDSARLEEILKESLKQAKNQKIKGKETTPFLLSKMSELSNGQTLHTNIALLKNNAKIATEIAVEMYKG